MQVWKKLGKIFEVNKNYDWMYSHASCPFVFQIDNNKFRIFFSTRDRRGFSHGAWIDVDMRQPFKILAISERPIIVPDEPGYFGDAGIVPFQILKTKNKYFMYYSGWTLKKTVPFDFYIGLAISTDNFDNFKKYSNVPILDRTHEEPFLIGAPWVIFEDYIYKMWYISGDKWEICFENNLKHYYSIKYAESKDGIYWYKRGIKCIKYENEFEYAFARPMVIHEKCVYKMWYSFRAQKDIDTYRIGYAESNDGINWTRKDDEVGMDVSETGWDSEMICYPFIFDHKGKRYMLYNGNGYGKTGFGLAVLEEE